MGVELSVNTEVRKQFHLFSEIAYGGLLRLVSASQAHLFVPEFRMSYILIMTEYP